MDYSADEVECWRTVYRSLVSLFPTHACDTHVRNFRLLERECGYSEHRIVQLEDVSNFLKSESRARRAAWVFPQALEILHIHEQREHVSR